MKRHCRVLVILEVIGEHKKTGMVDVEIGEDDFDLGKVPAVVDSIERLFIAAATQRKEATLTVRIRPLKDEEIV